MNDILTLILGIVCVVGFFALVFLLAVRSRSAGSRQARRESEINQTVRDLGNVDSNPTDESPSTRPPDSNGKSRRNGKSRNGKN